MPLTELVSIRIFNSFEQLAYIMNRHAVGVQRERRRLSCPECGVDVLDGTVPADFVKLVINTSNNVCTKLCAGGMALVSRPGVP